LVSTKRREPKVGAKGMFHIFMKSVKHAHEMECPLSHGGNLKLDSMPSIDMDKNLTRQLSKIPNLKVQIKTLLIIIIKENLTKILR
jgi:hypothetical protein